MLSPSQGHCLLSENLLQPHISSPSTSRSMPGPGSPSQRPVPSSKTVFKDQLSRLSFYTGETESPISSGICLPFCMLGD